MLDKETESEQHGKNGIRLPAKGKEKTVPDCLVGKIQPCALPRSVGKGIEIEMLN